MWINTIQQEQTNQTFLLFFGPYGTGVLRPILRERATFSTLNQTGICMWQPNFASVAQLAEHATLIYHLWCEVIAGPRVRTPPEANIFFLG